MNNIDHYMNNDTVGLISVAIIIFGIIWYLSTNTQKQLTINDYVVNTYLYILLAIFVCIVVMMIIGDFNLEQYIINNNFVLLIVFIVSIIILVAMVMIDKRQYILRHVLWLLFIICIAIVLFPIYDIAKRTSILWKLIISVTLIVIVLIYIASKYPIDYFNSWGPYLIVGLFGLIVFQLLDFIFSDPTDLYKRQKIYGFIGVILFSGFILYDTKKIYQHAQPTIINCQKITNQLSCADYPQESLNLFLDIINMFTSMTMTQI